MCLQVFHVLFFSSSGRVVCKDKKLLTLLPWAMQGPTCEEAWGELLYIF
jgi:hypothetical protein